MKKLLGGILLAIGILVALVSGLCTGLVLSTILWPVTTGEADMSGIPTVLAIGGIPFALGVAMIVGGLALVRSDREQ
ncbi:hypothetical protein GCM10011371_13650 [Novosphingobium marinum]|uniref:Putative membrane protein YphA (DoxX/SURF4 family) n=1 Tax=Novosphingobium marinum TaxID=1514948 RepID=A0A7Y9XYK4_9SPHN|nr:hypothetical protein [Novosphingobium marinum]NYH95473.1 putative membrane protein YphA (DoxX/SURF4 family) [Novosphingobium marinum]GGC27370.1 hypothetical protein GCM10011371_13650 [Novosphingobium marinum]